MRKSYMVAAILACVVGGVFLLNETRAQSNSPAPAPVRMAVCDVAEIFASYNRAADLAASLNERRQALAAELEQRRNAIELLQKEMEALKPGSDEYNTRQAEAERLKIDLAVTQQVGEARMLGEHRRLTVDMYEEILQAVGEIASQRGIDLVLYRDHGLVQTDQTVELLAQIRDRKVLYYSPGMDMTQEVLARMNEAYTASKAAGGQQPAPGPSGQP